jgi:hypothetical protein
MQNVAITELVVSDMQPPASGFMEVTATANCLYLTLTRDHLRLWVQGGHGDCRNVCIRRAITFASGFKEVTATAELFESDTRPPSPLGSRRSRRLPNCLNPTRNHLHLQVQGGHGGCRTVHTCRPCLLCSAGQHTHNDRAHLPRTFHKYMPNFRAHCGKMWLKHCHRSSRNPC